MCIKKYLMIVIFVVLFLSACNSEALPEVAEADTATPLPPTATPAPTNTPEPTDTSVPTATPAPTDKPMSTDTPTPEPSPTPTPLPDFEAMFEEAACAFDTNFTERDVTCGYLTVPENRQQLDPEDTLKLHVAIFASDSKVPEADPIIYLEGGPGGDALEIVPLVLEARLAPILADRDLIVIDQRGTGYSQPSLACDDVQNLDRESLETILSAEEEQDLVREALAECQSQLLEAGIDLTAYNSVENAADIEDLRQTLGYDQWNLYGNSYGTRLALTIMRDHPAGLRSVILDSPFPLQVNLSVEGPANFDRAFDMLFDACTNDPVCDAAYPNLREVFFEVRDQLDAEPVTLPVLNPLSGESYDVAFNGKRFLGVFSQALYNAELLPTLPEAIYDTQAGNYEVATLLTTVSIVTSEFLSAGMNISVQCNEEIVFSDPNEAAAAVAAYPEYGDLYNNSITVGDFASSVCADWVTSNVDPMENQAVVSDVPTLILVGDFDPITPPAWGQLTQETLANSYLYEFPGLSHGVTVSNDCPQEIMLDFLSAPTEAPDSSCIATLGSLTFVEEETETEDVLLVPFSDDTFGLSGLVPEGWGNIAPGTYARQASPLDQTSLAFVSAPGVDAQTFLTLILGQFGITEIPAVVDTVETELTTWSVYTVEVQAQSITIAVGEEGGFTILAMFVSSAEEADTLYEIIFLPILDAIELQ